MESSSSYHSVSSPSIEEWGSMEIAYEGRQRYCDCGLKAPRWTAWTEGNAGRRFYGCPNWFLKKKKKGGNAEEQKCCDFFEWHDSWYGKRAHEVIFGLSQEKKCLINERDRLWKEIKVLRAELGDCQQSEEVEFAACTLELIEVKAAVHELGNKVSDLEAKLDSCSIPESKNSILHFGWVTLLAFIVAILVSSEMQN